MLNVVSVRLVCGGVFFHRSTSLYNYQSCFMQEVMAWTSWDLLMVVMALKLLEHSPKTRR